MELSYMVSQLRKELSQGGMHTYHDCECGRAPCRSVKCWRCWETEIRDAVGLIHATWLLGKIRLSNDTESDIRGFIKSQAEAGGGQ